MISKNNTVYYVSADALLRNAGGFGSEQGYDEMKFTVALQGLLNRARPTLFVEQIGKNDGDGIKDEANFDVDRFWFDWLKSKNYMGNDRPDYREVRIEAFDALLAESDVADFIREKGLVIWDPEVPATSNAASIVCGMEGYLPVMAEGSVLARAKALGAEVKMDLTGRFTAEGTIWQTDRQTTGSKKCDTYVWALEKYGDRVCSDKVGYLCDSYAMRPKAEQAKALLVNGFNYATNQVASHDFFILNGAFVFDLSCFTDAIPLDDQGYGRTNKTIEYETFKEILLKLYQRNNGGIGTLTGFTPWSIKYTNFTNERPELDGLDGETTFVALCNAYNFIVDSDAPGMGTLSNTSFYSHVQLADHYDNPRPPKVDYDPAKKYVHIYMGDYDGSAWTNRFVAKYFAKTDPSYHAQAEKDIDYRGDRQITWAFNPNLSYRVPHAFLYMMENRTDKDFFVAGDSGAGYVFPDLFRAENETRKAISGLPDGMEAFRKWNVHYYEKFGIDITGFLLSHDVRIHGTHISNEVTQEVMDDFATFSGQGIVASRFPCCNITRFGKFNAIYKHGEFSVPVTIHNWDLYGGDEPVKEAARQMLRILGTADADDHVLNFRSIIVPPRDVARMQDLVLAERPDVVFVDMHNLFEMHRAAYGK